MLLLKPFSLGIDLHFGLTQRFIDGIFAFITLSLNLANHHMRFTTTTIIVNKAMVLFFLTLLPLYTNAQEVTTYYLIRHAEKQRLDPNDRDPSLTSKGFERANRWSVFY